ncbi:Gfo/Idh/MocA family oxidoreductase [Verrucomicrobium sp. BvORR106]|uniref:Gfo/Idh/MocA family protein n=1 Tax=Verrucomicrobium sp. BvORR106 TaxID=1403819 RepID=UPI00056FD1B9|nr:Gfo/Idh/MocA family oxidoreductase [Verrucomicrobium sp. BvORR106]
MTNSPPPLRLAMLGMIEGNGHPYSWSAIINGYDPVAMAQCPYPTILDYLGKQDFAGIGIPGARVTHVWTDDPADAPKVAAASLIEHVVSRPEDVIGQVDAVVISTDDGDDHVGRVAPFVEAGLPVFVDKPMATNLADLRQFVQWQRAGAVLLSSSGMRYAPELQLSAEQRQQLGELRWITSFTCKSWERYGIHALEAIYPLLGPGFETVQTQHRQGSDIVHLTHRSGVPVTLGVVQDAVGSFGAVHLYGTGGQLPFLCRDYYNAFRAQLVAFIQMLQTGKPPFPFSQTVELMAILVAGRRSRERDGQTISLASILQETLS